jgi:DASS family divalent anion:Na+ symporter
MVVDCNIRIFLHTLRMFDKLLVRVCTVFSSILPYVFDMIVGIHPFICIFYISSFEFSVIDGCRPIVLYFTQGFVSRGRWFGAGFIVSLVYVFVYLSVGLAWWKILGWW